MTTYTPTQADFLASFVRGVMAVPTTALPDNSTAVTYAFNVAMALVNPNIQAMDTFIYQTAVYNLAGDILINWAPDVPQTPPIVAPNLGYFANLRQQFKIITFIGGIISSAGDEGTSESIEVTETLKSLTVGQLQNLKTPYGRQYIALAQSVGTDWGIS